MADKSLIALAECVDSRTGKRFVAGDTFDPAPTEDQAMRLFKAGCLPEAAIAAAKKSDAAAQSAADAAAKDAEKAAAKSRELAVATDAVTTAQAEADAAADVASKATTDDDKAAAGKRVSAAAEGLKAAQAALAKLTK